MKNKIWNKNFNLGRITEKLLEHLADAIEAGYISGREFSDVKGTFTPFWDELEEEIEWFRKLGAKRRLVYELKRKRLISEKKTGDRTFYILTAKGAAELARRKILDCNKRLSGNNLCIVVFDIPESQRHVRDMFRRFLKEVGFKYVQQGVWIIDKDIVEAFRDFVKTIEADHWVNIFVVSEIVLKQSNSRASLTVRRLNKQLR